ncbi:hypothetical protein [Brassicibacter mesophilus]|uniref:hypothetical protein n=1 Tax=Brassicibacter mesophilus TaxID=745119 RepID=UPI003D231080
MKNKKIISIMLMITVLLSTFTSNVFAEDNITVYQDFGNWNGELKKMSVGGTIYEDGKLYYTQSNDYKIRIYDLNTKQETSSEQFLKDEGLIAIQHMAKIEESIIFNYMYGSTSSPSEGVGLYNLTTEEVILDYGNDITGDVFASTSGTTKFPVIVDNNKVYTIDTGNLNIYDDSVKAGTVINIASELYSQFAKSYQLQDVEKVGDKLYFLTLQKDLISYDLTDGSYNLEYTFDSVNNYETVAINNLILIQQSDNNIYSFNVDTGEFSSRIELVDNTSNSFDWAHLLSDGNSIFGFENVFGSTNTYFTQKYSTGHAFKLMLGTQIDPEEPELDLSQGEMVVNGDIQATVLNVTVPISTAFVINPNGATPEERFIAPDFTVSSGTNAPLKVSVSSLEQALDTQYSFTDVLPTQFTDEEWEKLNKIDSSTYLALALKTKDNAEWRSLTQTDPLYVKEVLDVGQAVEIGSLDPNSSATFTLEAKHGNAFDSAIQSKYSITFVFELLD